MHRMACQAQHTWTWGSASCELIVEWQLNERESGNNFVFLFKATPALFSIRTTATRPERDRAIFKKRHRRAAFNSKCTTAPPSRSLETRSKKLHSGSSRISQKFIKTRWITTKSQKTLSLWVKWIDLLSLGFFFHASCAQIQLSNFLRASHFRIIKLSYDRTCKFMIPGVFKHNPNPRKRTAINNAQILHPKPTQIPASSKTPSIPQTPRNWHPIPR